MDRRISIRNTLANKIIDNMISFENELFASQLLGSYGMSEVYVDIISGIFLFLANIIGSPNSPLWFWG
jgi:hypothetical protein